MQQGREGGPIVKDRLSDNLAGAWNQAVLSAPANAVVLIIDDREINTRLLGALLRQDGCQVLIARRAAEALEMLERERVDLVILDMILPEMDGLECCRRIKSNRRTELIPVLMVTCAQGAENEIAGIASGADEYLLRPFHPDVLRTRVRSMLRHKSAVDRLEESETILFALAQAVEQRDNYTAGHCERLAVFSVALGMAMNLPPAYLLALHRGGYLHDIGKVGIPDSILYKAGPLSEPEWRMMRTHTLKGEEICRPMKCLAPILPIIRSHHERWDGSGYPDALRGPQIPLLARVLQLADVFDALSTARPYKPALSAKDALALMQTETGRGWYEPDLVNLFLRLDHEELQSAALRNATAWKDVGAMQQSLENMQQFIARA